MTEAEDKEKAEKLAAAKKRYEQLKKQKKSKEDKTEAPKKKKKDRAEDKAVKDEAKEDTAPTDEEEETTKEDVKGEDDAEIKDEETPGSAESSAPKKGRQPSLSLASRMRSESFKRDLYTDADGGLKSPDLKSSSLPSPGEEGDAVQGIFKRQKERIHALEEENKRLQKDTQEKSKLEEELEELREKQGETVGLRKNDENSYDDSGVIERLNSEITTLRDQLKTTQQSQRRRPSSTHINASEDLTAQLSTKQATIETLELDISNLRHSLFQVESTTSELESRISTLSAELETSKTENTSLISQISTLTTDLASAKSLNAPSDPSTTTDDASTTQAQLSSTLTSLSTAESIVTTLTKKIETLQTLHRDSETRATSQNALRLKEMDRLRAETTEMRRKLQARSYENARLRSVSTSSASAPPPLDETGTPMDSNTASARIRELEAEVFELRSGVYRERNGQLVGGDADTSAVFDEVDLSSPSVAEARARRAAGPYGAFSSLLNTFAGTGARRASRPGTGAGTEKHVGFLGESRRVSGDGGAELSDDEGSFAFDEEAFRAAQEEEARKRVERVREVKRRLPEWRGWRVDLVDLRGGSMAGVFEV